MMILILIIATSCVTPIKSSKISVGIGQSNKVLPTKLSQPIRSTRPLKRTVWSTSITLASHKSRRKPFGSSSFAGGKAKSSTSTTATIKDKGKHLSIFNQSKLVGMHKKRKSSFGRLTRRRLSLSVGTKALSHRVSWLTPFPFFQLDSYSTFRPNLFPYNIIAQSLQLVALGHPSWYLRSLDQSIIHNIPCTSNPATLFAPILRLCLLLT